MIEVAKQQHVVLMEALKPTFTPMFGIIETLMPKIGKIRRFVSSYGQSSSRYPAFKNGKLAMYLSLRSQEDR